MQKNNRKTDTIKFPRQNRRRRFGIGMAKVSSVCPSVRRSSGGRLRRISLNEPVRLAAAPRRRNSVIFLLPILGLIAILSVTMGKNFWQDNTNSPKGKVLGEEEVKNEILSPYSDIKKDIPWPGGYLSFQYLNAEASAPEVLTDYYIYRNVYDNVDVWLEPSDFSLRQKILLLRPGHAQSFAWQLSNLSNWQIEIKKGTFSFYKKDSTAPGGLRLVYFIPTPYVEDGEGQRSVQAAKFKLEGNVLELVLDEAWLQEAAYPVTLDFTINRR